MVSLPQFLGPARALCPECLREAPGGYYTEDDRVVLRRACKEHGPSASAFWEDIGHYQWTMEMEARAGSNGNSACCAPGTPGCGNDNGTKRCMTVIPITDGCNLECPYCFAASSPRMDHRPIGEIKRMLSGALQENGGPTPLQLSGGEPTVHPDLFHIVRAARDLGYRHIEVNTNGIQIAHRDGFAQELHAAGVDVLYLQFDGLRPESYVSTRGLDLVQAKRRAVAHARAADLSIVLAPTIVKDRNDHELGDILRFALENRDVVRGVNFQPVRHFGRFAEDTGHLSPDMVAKRISEQTAYLRPEDMLPFPCCSSACYLATVLLPVPAGALPLTRFVREPAFLDALRGVGDRMFMDLLAGTGDAAAVVESVACGCQLPLAGLGSKLLRDTVTVAVTSFMDAHTADLDRMGRCCVRVATRSGRLAPFCGYYLTDARGAYAWRNRHYPEDRALPIERHAPLASS